MNIKTYRVFIEDKSFKVKAVSKLQASQFIKDFLNDRGAENVEIHLCVEVENNG